LEVGQVESESAQVKILFSSLPQWPEVLAGIYDCSPHAQASTSAQKGKKEKKKEWKKEKAHPTS